MDDTGDGPTHRLLWALYVATLGVGVTLAALAGEAGDLLVPLAVFGWFGAATLAFALLEWRGTPRPLAPRPLYGSGYSGVPALVGLLPALAAVVAVTRSLPSGVVVALAFATLSAPLGWLLRVVARNVTAREFVDDGVDIEWKARPSPARRRGYYVVAGAFAVVALAVSAYGFLHDGPNLLALVGSAVALAASARQPSPFRVTDDALVVGNTQYLRPVPWSRVERVVLTDAALRVERAGAWPALTCDREDLHDEPTVFDALREHSALEERQ